VLEDEKADEFTLEEIREQFKVFKDPTFQEFIQIVGTSYNGDLPLFAQLYILREYHQFTSWCQN
jgi:hypothetical protein